MKSNRKIAFLTSALVLFSVIVGCANQTNLGKTSSSVDVGSFDNGIKYLVQENHFDSSKASLRLVVNTGSAVETEKQRGLAHFVEHMVFRGTENYSDGEVIKYLESIGASFGADTNAYTAFDETVYFFEIPLEKEDALENGLKMLCDFAFRAKFDQSLVDKEKNVILDELRIRLNSAEGRMSKLTHERFLENTRYAKRLPAGLEAVVKNCQSEDLFDYYNAWYRPENVSIVAVGDFDKNEVIKKIKNIYSKISRRSSLTQTIDHKLPRLSKSRAMVIQDKEFIFNYFSGVKLLPAHFVQDEKDLKEETLEALAFTIANKRLEKIAEQDETAFKGASISRSNYCRDYDMLRFVVAPWEGKELLGLEKAVEVAKTFFTLGGAKTEFNEVILSFTKSYQKALENLDKRKNASIAWNLVESALNKTHPREKRQNILFCLSLLNSLTLDELNDYILALDFDKINWDISYATGKEESFIKEEDIVSLVDETSASTSEEPQEVSQKQFKLNSLLNSGSVEQVEKYEHSQIERVKLSNNMTIYLKHSDLKKNIVQYQIFAKGGLASFEKQDFPSASIASSYAQMSGLAGLTPTELTTAFAGKHATLSYQGTLKSRQINGSASKENIPELFQLICALFQEKYFRESSWKQLINQIDEFLKQQENHPGIQFSKTYHKMITSDHYLFEDPKIEDLDQNKAKQIMNEMFSNPAEFTMVLVGDFDPQTIKSDLAKYLASIPKTSTSVESTTPQFIFPEGVVEQSIPGGVGEKSETVIVMPLKSSGVENSIGCLRNLTCMSIVLEQRLRESIRMQQGATYGIRAGYFNLLSPEVEKGYITVSYSTDPNDSKHVYELVKKEIKNLSFSKITQDELTVAKEMYAQGVKDSFKSLSGHLSDINNKLAYGEDLSKTQTLEQRLSQITLEKVQSLADKVLDLSNFVSLTQESIKQHNQVAS